MLLLFFTSLIKAANKRMAKDYINQTNKTTNRTDQNSVQVCNNRKRKLKDSDFTDRSMISESKRIRCKKEINKSNLKNKKNATEQHEFNNIPLFVHEYTLEDSDEEYRPISSQQIHNKEELEVGSQPRKNNTNNSVNTNSSLDTKEKNKFSFNSKRSDIDLELLIQSVISKPNKEPFHFDSSGAQLECKNKESFILEKEETLLMNEKQKPLFLDTVLPLINTADLENVLNSNYQMTKDTQINSFSFADTNNIQPEQNLRHMEKETFSMNKYPSTSNFKLQNSSETHNKCLTQSNSYSFRPDEVDLKIHMPINSQFNEDNARHSKSLGIYEHKTDLVNTNNADSQYINTFQECYNYYTKVEYYDPQEFERNDSKYIDLDALKIKSALEYPKSDEIKECSQRLDGIIPIKQFDLEESSNVIPITIEQTHRKDCFESENIKSSAIVETITNEEESKTNTILETSIDYGINGHHNTKRLNNNIVPKKTNNKSKRCRITKRFKSKNVDLINTRDTSALNENLLDLFKSMSAKDSCRCISTDSIPAGIYITNLYKDVEISKIVKDIESMYIIRFNNVIFNFYNFSHVLRIFEHYDDKKRPEIKENIDLFLKNFIRDNILDREFWLEVEKTNVNLATYTSDSFVELNTVLCIDDFREYMLKFCKKYEKIMGNFTEKLSILRHRRREDHTFSSVAKVFLFEFEQFFKNERFSNIFVLFPEINYLLNYLRNDKFYFFGLKQAVATISFVIFKFLFLKENFFIDLKHHQAIYRGDYLKSNLFLKFLLNTKALLYATYCKITLMKVNSDLKKKMIFHIYLHFLRLKNPRVFTLLKFDEHVYLENSERVVNYDWIILSSESIFVDSDRLEIFLIDDFAINSVRNFAENADGVLYKTLAINEEYNDFCHVENEDNNLIEQKYKESKEKFYVKLLESLSH